jgi:hypothetical protein
MNTLKNVKAVKGPHKAKTTNYKSRTVSTEGSGGGGTPKSGVKNFPIRLKG